MAGRGRGPGAGPAERLPRPAAHRGVRLLSAGLSLAKVAAYLGDTKEVVLATYAHFMPDDDDRAREIMNAFFRLLSEGADQGSCALIVPGGTL